MPQKKYIVRLTDEEREICRKTVRKLKASSEKVRRAQILLKADADGPGWLVLYHVLHYGARIESALEEVRAAYDGDVVLADDLDVF